MASGDIIKLNVGGKIFHTTRSTLTKYDGYFKAMIESEITPKTDETGCIFIDRSPQHFDTILNFLRDGDVPIPDSEYEKEQILKESQYYMINGLIHLCGGETSDEWKKANLVAVHLRDWERGNGNCEILFADADEVKDFVVLSNCKNSLEIRYNPLYWGDILCDTIVQDFVEKHSKDWNILFFHFEGDFPEYFIKKTDKNPTSRLFRGERYPKVQAKEFFEQIERRLLQYQFFE